MFKKTLLLIILLCGFSWGTALAEYVPAGKLDDGTPVFLDTEIRPIAYVDKKGAQVVIDGMFMTRYRIDTWFNTAGIADLKAMRYISDSKGWTHDKKGADGFLAGAYIVRDYAKILDSRPLVIKSEALPRNRKPAWPVNSKGWQKVYEREDGGQAWVQTKSAILSYSEGERLPHVRVLVRRLEITDGQPEISFYYESYDPEQRTKQVLKSWDKDRREQPVDTETLHQVPVLSKDAAIATSGYNVFVSDYEQTTRRARFTVGENELVIDNRWLVF